MNQGDVKRPQHVVASAWRKFDNELIRKDGWDDLAQGANDFGMELKAVKDVRSPEIRKLLEEAER